MRWLPLLVLTPLLALTPVSSAAQAGDAAAAGGNSVDTVVAAVEATYKDVTSISADFTQTTRNLMMGDETVQKGKVQIKRPRKMRWEFNEPRSSFVTNGKTMWVYTATDNQVLVTEELGSGGGDGMTQLLDGLDELGEHFDVKLTDETDTEITLELSPKAQANFKVLRLTLAKDGYSLQQVVMVDPFDNTTELAFEGVALNAEVPDSAFDFQIPAGATVVKPSGI